MGFSFPARRAGIHEDRTEQKIAKNPIKKTAPNSMMMGIVSR
jgi:hypothetical protein